MQLPLYVIMGAISGVIAFSLVYFIPTIVASHRHHPQLTAIFILNLFLGWSLIGWVGALVWAVLHQQRPLLAA